MKLDLVTNASIDDDTRRLTLTKTVVKREAKVINLSMAETIWEDIQAELNNRSRIVDADTYWNYDNALILSYSLYSNMIKHFQ